ncbi:MAG: hypothetical protein WC229_03750 [Candidatus Paceibacterota bacterium]|jgi:hypothetical protein
MSVQFEEENRFNESFKKRDSSGSSGGITKWLIKNRIVKDEKGANKIMVIVTIICLIIAVYFQIK